jgi:hypothetical protein
VTNPDGGKRILAGAACSGAEGDALVGVQEGHLRTWNDGATGILNQPDDGPFVHLAERALSVGKKQEESGKGEVADILRPAMEKAFTTHLQILPKLTRGQLRYLGADSIVQVV